MRLCADAERQGSKEDIAQTASVKCGKRLPPPCKKSGRRQALTYLLCTALPGRFPLIPAVVVAVIIVSVMIVNVMIAVIIGAVRGPAYNDNVSFGVGGNQSE
jgi:hypothetical protein